MIRFMPPTVIRSVVNVSSTTSQATRSYIPLKSPLRQHNARRHWSSTSRCALNELHNAAAQRDPLDGYLETIISKDLHHVQTSIQNIYSQYQARAYTVIDRVIPYEERPKHDRRADAIITGEHGAAGNGLVTVIHAIWNDRETRLEKVAVCSGFVVDASVNDSGQGDTIVTCAHTLEQIRGSLQATGNGSDRSTLSFILTPRGEPRPVVQLLASLPRNDLLVLEVEPLSNSMPRLASLPMTPFPVYTGTPLLTHLFGAPCPPVIRHSVGRMQRSIHPAQRDQTIEQPICILDGKAFTRLAHSTMLGYRSFSGLELEAGIHSSLPHILTSVLPTAGSSGGPMINADTGCVVGVISGRRMDNRVEGERGWGSSGEGVFEMFSLPGFQPSQKQLTWSR